RGARAQQGAVVRRKLRGAPERPAMGYEQGAAEARRQRRLVQPELTEEVGEAIERRDLAVVQRAEALGLPPARAERLVARLEADLGRLRSQDAVQHAGGGAHDLAVDLDLGHALAIEADQRVEEIEEDRAVGHQRGFLPA